MLLIHFHLCYVALLLKISLIVLSSATENAQHRYFSIKCIEGRYLINVPPSLVLLSVSVDILISRIFEYNIIDLHYFEILMYAIHRGWGVRFLEVT